MTITRFAPSPTGYLHIGGLRTALYNYLWAKKNNGQFKLRIEDTDFDRNNDNAIVAIINSFHWTNLSYDDDVIYQSKRLDIYKAYVNKLLETGHAYKCYMSKEELDALRAKQLELKQTTKYDRTWRPEINKILPNIPDNIEPVIRMRVPDSGKIEFKDGVKGKISVDLNEIDDFVIVRSDGIPTYNFVAVIDDSLMNITEVIRGDDHLSNTPKQIVIYNALGFNIPKFYHIPMINNPNGNKLSKRDGAMDVMEYRNKGILPEALLNFLVRLGWSYGNKEIFSIEEMINLFNPSNINKSSASFNESKLLWINGEYIKKSSNDYLIKELEYFGLKLNDFNKKYKLLNLVKPRSKTLLEMHDLINSIINVPKTYKEFNRDYLKYLNDYINLIKNSKDLDTDTKKFISDNCLNVSEFFSMIRIGLMNSDNSPPIHSIIEILGVDESCERLNKLL